MSNLVIDIGNTLSKVAVFENQKIAYFEQFDELNTAIIAPILKKFMVTHSTVSSVNTTIGDLETFLAVKTKYRSFNTSIKGKIKNHYQTPETLGLDRWAKIIAASTLYPQQNCLLIDSGTCITYDILNAKNEYFGGSISLGIRMRFNALNYYTGRLPLIEFDKNINFNNIGTNTENAIKTGVIHGVLYEIKGFIQKEIEKYPDLKIILTGGDSIFLTKPLKNSIFATQLIHEPYLVLKGLNEAINLENE